MTPAFGTNGWQIKSRNQFLILAADAAGCILAKRRTRLIITPRFVPTSTTICIRSRLLYFNGEYRGQQFLEADGGAAFTKIKTLVTNLLLGKINLEEDPDIIMVGMSEDFR